jgi:polyhydroxyalkanoate synthesis regulator phasin
VKEAKAGSSDPEPAAKLVAERWGLEYREAHTLSIDPNVLSIIDGAESRRLQVLPLEIGPDGPIFAVADPNEERFAAVRSLAGANVTFVIVAQDTLDALLSSKVFSVDGNGGGRSRPSLFRQRSPEPPAPASREPEPADSGAGDDPTPIRETATAESGVPGSLIALEGDETGATSDMVDSLLDQLTAGTGSLKSQVDDLTAALNASQEQLRAAQEELRSALEEVAQTQTTLAAHNETVDGLEREIVRLSAELTASRSLNDAMTARLRDLVQALGAPAPAKDAPKPAAEPWSRSA